MFPDLHPLHPLWVRACGHDKQVVWVNFLHVSGSWGETYFFVVVVFLLKTALVGIQIAMEEVLHPKLYPVQCLLHPIMLTPPPHPPPPPPPTSPMSWILRS